jgi:hypothetical protein
VAQVRPNLTSRGKDRYRDDPSETGRFLPLKFVKHSYRHIFRNRDSVIGIATGYGLDDRGVGVRVPVG